MDDDPPRSRRCWTTRQRTTASDPALIESFITRWSAANDQRFLTELCTLLGLHQPAPTPKTTPIDSSVG